MPRQSTEEILAEFDSSRSGLEAACARTKSLLEAVLQGRSKDIHSIDGRVKTRQKLATKYSKGKNYQKLIDITDLVGVRIITYFEREVEAICKIIESEFKIDTEHSPGRRKYEADRFGYQSVHYVCTYSDNRREMAEYRSVANVVFELQIRSILQHAWAEMEHDWYDDRENLPDPIKRRFSRLMGLFEIAEDEFFALRAARTAYENSVSLMASGKADNMSAFPMDAISLAGFIEGNEYTLWLEAQFAGLLGDRGIEPVVDHSTIGTFSRGARVAGFNTIDSLLSFLTNRRAELIQFVMQVISRLPDPVPSPLCRGISVYYSALFNAAAQGREALIATLITIYSAYDSDGGSAWIDETVEISKRLLPAPILGEPQDTAS